MPFRKISWWKNINKKEEISSYLVYNIVSLEKMAGKTEAFTGFKITVGHRTMSDQNQKLSDQMKKIHSVRR